MKKKVFYTNVLRVEEDMKIDVKEVLKRLKSISSITKDIDEISKTLKKNVEKSK